MEGRRFTGPLACGSLAEKSNVAMPSAIVIVTASLICGSSLGRCTLVASTTG
jgi:hypothetical protein